MNLPSDLRSREYYNGLREYRDQALEKSNAVDSRRSFGGLTGGKVMALWEAEDGYASELTYSGLVYKNRLISKVTPTVLRIFNRIDYGGSVVTTFRMNLENMHYIRVYKNMMIENGLADRSKATAGRILDRRHGLHEPTDADRELLYSEMCRGASGVFPLDTGFMND